MEVTRVKISCTTAIMIGIIQQTRIPNILTLKLCIKIISNNAKNENKYVLLHPIIEWNDTQNKIPM